MKRYQIIRAWSSSPVAGGGGADWQLDSGHYVPAVAASKIIHPRPDGETNSWERCRLAPSDIAYRLPIVVNHGAWPFHYDITSGPTGMTIGADYGDTDYGILTWETPTIGTHSIAVRVRTQDYGRSAGSADTTNGGELTVSFTLVVADKTDNTKFLFMDASGGSDGNSGAYGSPWQTLSAFASASTSGKQLFFRTGTYNTSAASSLDLSSKAKVWIGYPGESPRISMAGSSGKSVYATGPGVFMGNLNPYGGNSTQDDYYHFNASGDRATMFECVSEALTASGNNSGFANCSGWTMFADPAIHQYLAIVNNTFKDYTTITNGGASILYSVTEGVMEGNLITGMNLGGSTEGFRTKGYCKDVTIRNNRAPSNQTFGGAVFTHYQGADGGQGDIPNNNEMCWNYARQASGNECARYGTATFDDWTGWVFRNTFTGYTSWASWGSTCSLLLQENVLLNNSGNANDNSGSETTGLTLTNTNNVIRTISNIATTIDSGGLLLDSYLSGNGLTRGTRGHEVL